MKKVLLSIVVIATMGITSCGGGAVDAMLINAGSLETVCECGDAALAIASE